jgi:hypothetical protein
VLLAVWINQALLLAKPFNHSTVSLMAVTDKLKLNLDSVFSMCLKQTLKRVAAEYLTPEKAQTAVITNNELAAGTGLDLIS